MKERHDMGETLHLQFRSREDGTFELHVKESWSGHIVKGDFIPPYSARQLSAVLKKLNTLETDERELREIGQRLFRALCGTTVEAAGSPGARDSSEHSVQALLRSVIQRTLRRRGTVALTLIFLPGCDEFIGYPWELLHNGEHFLVASGIFTLTRALLRPDMPQQSELPVFPPLRLLYIGVSPLGCPQLETERSYESLARGLTSLIEEGQLFLDRLEPPTFDELVSYLNSYGGTSAFDDTETAAPCYAIHFDGHGAFGRLCPADNCDELNDAEARKCRECGTSLGKVKSQTYLCFCDDDGRNRYIGTETLRELLVSSDVRMAVFSACETARVFEERARHKHGPSTIDATLATALVMAQIPAVVAMPFSLQDDLSPTFMYHFYDALAHGRTLEEALSRARQALLPIKQQSWFVPVLYRYLGEGSEGPVPLLAGREEEQEHDHPLFHLGATTTFVGREREIEELSDLLQEAVRGESKRRARIHHFALTGPAGIGKSELAFEVARRSAEKFPGGIIGISLQGGKALGESLLEIAHSLHIHTKAMNTADTPHCERTVLNAYRILANRDLPCLLLLDGFEEVQEHADVGGWYRFLCSLPDQVVVLLTSRSNPSTVASLEGSSCRWYEYPVGKMTSADIMKLFAELAAGSGLDERIHLSEPRQQAILQEICTLLDGYPLGAQLIFGTARPIHGKIYAPEASTRSLEEVRDELREALPEGMWALLDLAYHRLSSPAQQLLPYLASFKLPFSHQQIVMLFTPDSPASARALGRQEHDLYAQSAHDNGTSANSGLENAIPVELLKNWRAARDELVRSSFIQFDGRVYTIHAQVRHFALALLSEEERLRVHRVVANYYSSLPQPSPEEWFAAFEHLEDAGEAEDLHKAVHLIVKAAWTLHGRGYASSLRALLRRAEIFAVHQGDLSGEAQIQYCLGAILRQLGKYAEALACLTRSLALHREQRERDEEAWALFELAMLFREEGQYQQAGKHAEMAISLFREANDAKGEAWMHTVLGEVCRGRGEYYKARGYFEQALTMFRTLPDDDGYAWTLADRGTIFEALGNYPEALADIEESLRLFSMLGSRYGQAWAQAHLGAVYIDLAEFEQAGKVCNEALATFREHGVRRGEGRVLQLLGDIARKRREYNDAHTCYGQSQVIFNDLGDRVDQARVINSLGAVSLAEGEYPVAKSQFEHARAIAREQEARQIEERALRGLGDAARAARQFGEAERCYDEAAAIANDLDMLAERCAILHRRGDLHAAQGHVQDALVAWIDALFQDHRVGHPERVEHEQKVARFVREHHLEEYYLELRRQYGL